MALIGAGAIVLGSTVASAGAAVAEEDGAQARISLTGDVETLNPFLSVLSTSDSILMYQYEPLVAWAAEDNSEYPAIAESWEANADATEWTFHLEPDALWSDGEPIVADDVIWTIEAIQDNDALKMAKGSLVENIASIEAPDELTVVMTMENPQAPNPGADLPIVPSHVWAALDDPAAYENDADTVGSGPFIITESSKTSGVTMKANPHYRHGEAKIDSLVWVPYKSSDAAVQALKTGEVDLVDGLTIAQFDSLDGVDGITTISAKGNSFSALAINPGAKDIDGNDLGDGNPVLQDKVVRQAIVRAIDNETLRAKILQGLGDPGTGTVPPRYPTFHWNIAPEELPLAYDPDEANRMLDEAGYERGADGVRLDKSGNPIDLRIMGRSSSSNSQQAADFIGPWLEEIGIKTTVSMLSDAQVNDESVLGRYDMYFTGWGMGPDPDFMMSINLCSSRPDADGSGATSESNWCDPAFDELYAQQHSETDPEKRAALILEMQQLKYDAAVNNVMFFDARFQAYRSDRFTDAQLQPAEGGVLLRQNGPWGVYSLTPVAGTGDETAADGGAAGWWIAGGIGAVILLGGGILLSRRRSQAGDRE
ncbi:ABC transporter substrate-binding protein [Microbacterium saperdae]